MGCCIGAKHSNWCADYDIVYVDGAGKGYCIFHAPAECKFVSKYVEGIGDRPELISGEDFNALVFARIDAAIDEGDDDERDKYDFGDWNPRCNFAGTIFFADISFFRYNGEDKKSLPSIKFDNAQFCRNTYWDSSHFRVDVSFVCSQFFADASFISSQFFGSADFSFSRFRGDADFRSSQFFGDAHLDSIHYHSSADFISSQFHGNASFCNTQYRMMAYFSSCYFNNVANFSGCQFRFISDFSHSQFRGVTSFKGCQFRRISLFKTSKFWRLVEFSFSQFRLFVDFHGSDFQRGALFDNSQFRGGGNFSELCLKKVDFHGSESRKPTSFNSSTFGDARFDGMSFKGAVFFDEAWFLGDASFKNTIFYDYSNFEKAQFYGETNFKHTLFKEWTYFRNVVFNQKTSFAGAISKETILIEATNLSNFTLAETNIESFRFTECAWPELKDRQVVYDEILNLEKENNFLRLEEIYRRLKKISRDNNDEILASAWHYKEKEMLRKRLHHENKWTSPKTLFLRALNNIYWAISGYGEEPLRAFVFLFLFIACPLLMALYFGPFYQIIQSGELVNTNKHLVSCWLWYLPLTKVPLDGAIISDWNYFWKGAFNILITIQAALFAFALRNKLRR